MILVVSTFTGITEAGSKVADAIFDLVKKNYPEVRLEGWTALSGEMGVRQMAWWHPSLAAKEAFEKKVFADPRWTKAWEDAGPGPYYATQRDDFFTVTHP